MVFFTAFSFCFQIEKIQLNDFLNNLIENFRALNFLMIGLLED
jgi:hypothetical protein